MDILMGICALVMKKMLCGECMALGDDMCPGQICGRRVSMVAND